MTLSHLPEPAARADQTHDAVTYPQGEGGDTALDLLPLWFERGLVVVTAAVLSFGGFGLLLAVVGVYHILPVLAVGTVLTVLASFLGWPRRNDHGTGDRRMSLSIRYPAICMCIMALGFAVWNGSVAAHHVGIGRDSGVYAVTGKWIATHGGLEVPTDAAGAANVGTAVVLPGTYLEDGTNLEFQFNHLLPVFLAEADNLGGDPLLFRVPALLGALALCAVYAAGCLFVRRPWFVLVSVGALAISLPQLNVSRDTFSESSVQLLLWSGLWITATAYRRKRFGMALLAGAALGGTLLGRVDAFAYLIPLPILGALGVLVANSAAERRHLWKLHFGMIIGAFPVALLGTFDAVGRAGIYAADLGPQIRQLRLAMVGSVLLGIGLLAVWPRLASRTRPLADWVVTHRQGLSVGSALAPVLGLLAAWTLRPVAMHGRGDAIGLIGSLQAAAGLPVDPTRTYAEFSLPWISWYIGPITLTLSIIGVAVVVTRMWHRMDSATALILTVTGLVSAIYLWKPSIVADQIWAMRRFVPATLPLIVLLAAIAIAAISDAMATSAARAAWQRPVATAGAASMLAFPLSTTLPVANFETQANAVNVVKALCKTVGRQSAIIIARDDPAGFSLTPAVRTWCDVPVALLDRPQAPAEIQQIARHWRTSGRTLWVVGSSRTFAARYAPGTPVSEVGSAASPRELELTVQRPPQSYVLSILTMYAGPVSAP